MRFLLSCFVLFNSFIATSQNHIFSHLSSGFDESPYSSTSTPDSGFVIAGYTKESTQNWALYVYKYDKVGTKEWGYQYDGSSSKKDLLHDIVLASDSGFLISGRTWSYLTMGGDSYIIKLDKNGNHVFTTVVDGKSTHWYNAGLAIDEMSNGEIIQAGMYHMAYNPVRYDWEINRFSSTGVHLKTFFIGLLNGNEYATDVLSIDSGQYLMAGFTETATTGDDFGFLHADSNDNNLYFASYSGSGDERCMQIIRNSDNTYYLAGFSDSYGAGGIDFAVIKLDSVWNILWQKTYGGTGNDELIAACSDGNDGLVLGGYTDGYNAQGTDNLLVRIDSSGNTIKSITFGGDFDDEIASLSLDNLGNYIIQSKTNSFTGGGINDLILVKTDSSLNPECEFNSVSIQVNNASFSTVLGATEISGITYSNNETLSKKTYSFNETKLTPYIDAGPDQIKCDHDSIVLTAIDSSVSNISWNGGIINGVPFMSSLDSFYYITTGTNYLCSLTDSMLLVIDSPLNMAFNISMSSSCSPLNVDFIPSGNNNNISSCLWVFGDGDSSSVCGPVSHSYVGTGCYDIIYSLKNTKACVSDTSVFNMFCLDSAHIEAPDTFLCLGDSMTLTAIGTNTDSLVGTYQLDMTAAVNVFTDPTIAGESYYFKASGTWSGAGSCENRDPFYYFMNGCQPVNNYATSWKFNGAKPPKPMPLQYNSQHEYFFYFTGSGGQENFTFNDSNYGDNSGVLTFELYHIYADYIWSTGDTTKSINVKPLNDTTYYVSIDNGTCISVDSFSIDVVNLTSSSTITDVLCYGDSSGVAEILTIGGNGSYNYEWPSFTTTSSITNGLYSGSYSITISDNDYSCLDTIDIIINQPNPYNISELVINASCNGGNSGSVDLSVTGNTSPYSYSWSNGSSSEDLSQVIAGTYTVTISDSNSCDTILTYNIIEPDPLTASLNGDTIICIGDTAKIFATGNGVFFWPYNNQADSFLFVWPENDTTYTFMSWDQNNCDTIIISWSVIVKPLPEGILTNDTTILYGSNILINSSSGTSYVWSPEEYLNCSDCQNPEAGPLSPTWYYLFITNEFSCSSFDSIYIDVLIEDAIYIANAFTPNMDGNNDILYVHPYGVKNILFNIYNRWGRLIFSSNDPSIGWDGTYKSKPQEGDIYVYVIEAEFLDGTNKVLKGDVTLIR